MISRGLEGLPIQGVVKMLKDYSINFDKLKLRFLFKRLASDGSLATYPQFLDIMTGIIDTNIDTIYEKFQCLQAFSGIKDTSQLRALIKV